MALLSAFQFLTKAEALNQHCKSMFTIEETNNFPNKGIFPYPAISNIEITEPGIYFQIAILTNLWAQTMYIRETATDIAPSLTHLFHQPGTDFAK